jgi:8-oxo-dGTP diphosphatase
LSSFDRITVGALAVVPGPGQTVTFVRQERGPYAGWWLLPGGKTDFGESLEETARREAAEEAGCRVGPLRLTGAYEMRVTWARGDYHLLMFAFRAEGVAAAPPDGFYGHHVAGVRQDRPSRVRTHPTVMRILRDAGVADHPQAEIDAALAREGITMTSYPVGAGTLVR